MTRHRPRPTSPAWPDDGPLPVWTDRYGERHQERRPEPHRDEPRMDRVLGELEREWADPRKRAALTVEALDRPNPAIDPDPLDGAFSLWTWVVDAPDARSVLLWTNPVFDHGDVAQAEFTHLEESTLWTICLRLPSALRASYRIAIWSEDETPPWRHAQGRRETILAAMAHASADPRCTQQVKGSSGEVSSVAAGPNAPTELWNNEGVTEMLRFPHTGQQDDTRVAHESSVKNTPPCVEELPLPDDQRAWVYSPPGSASETPLLVLFDGQVWQGMELPQLLDHLIRTGALPPLHVAMIDSGDQSTRWSQLGVPSAQVETVIDQLLPRVRAEWDVDPRGCATIVSGQSLGGIAALWTLALSQGAVQHAIAQSASLWRFDMVEPLLRERSWRTIELHAGSFEGDMLTDAEQLASRIHDDPRLNGRRVDMRAFEAGHDWAAWRANLLSSLGELLPRLTQARAA